MTDVLGRVERDPLARANADLAFFLGGVLSPASRPEKRHVEYVEEEPQSEDLPPAANPLARLIEQVLEAGARRGHVAAYWENLVREVCYAAKLGDGLPVDQVIAADTKRFHRECLGGQELVYLQKYYRLETRVVAHLRRLLRGRLPWRSLNLDAGIAHSEAAKGLTLSPGQRNAVVAVLGSKVTVITGGPGTGKTTMTNVLLHVIEQLGVSVTLCAPTGRAARRLSEATGLEASTIHRLIGVGGPSKGSDSVSEIDTDLVVVDETSMLDVELTAQLLSSLPSHAALVLLGDARQLPSVGPGQILEDLIDSGVIPCPRLTDVHRQASDSGIVLNATRIIDGTTPATEAGKPDFVVLDSPGDRETVARLKHLASTLIPEKMGLDPLREIQVLAPMRKGMLGTESLNQVLQQALNPGGGSSWTAFRLGDRVMQVSNDYERRVFNGDIGFVAWINDESKILRVDFGRHPVVYKQPELAQLTLAYAITVHKSQGSEFPVCLIPLARDGSGGLTRRLLYTAVTRGKKKVIVIGHADAVAKTVNNSRDESRVSGLLHRLRDVH